MHTRYKTKIKNAKFVSSKLKAEAVNQEDGGSIWVKMYLKVTVENNHGRKYLRQSVRRKLLYLVV